MRYKFLGENLPSAHLYANFTLGKNYEIRRKNLAEVYRSHEFYWTVDDTGKDIMVSNNAKRKYFRKIKPNQKYVLK